MSTAPIGTAAIIEALESTNSAAPPTFQDLLIKLWEMRYQGNLTLHFAGGLPRSVTLNQPVQIPLDSRSALTSAGK